LPWNKIEKKLRMASQMRPKDDSNLSGYNLPQTRGEH